MFLTVFPFILSALLAGAHFLRSNSLLPVLLCLAAPLLLLIRQRWSLYVLQVFSVVVALLWLLTLWAIIQERIYEGRSWLASGIILGLVALFTLFAGWLLGNGKLKERYPS